MKKRKVRGHRRRQRQILEWMRNHEVPNLDHLEKYGYDYVKIRIRPWSDFILINSCFPEPKGTTRDRMIQGLEHIYDHWKAILEPLGQPYYLKIWLYETQVSRSQVVCATGDRITYYENLFRKSAEVKEQMLPKKLSADFKWELFYEDEYWSENDLQSTAAEDAKLHNRSWALQKLKSLRNGDFYSNKYDDDTVYFVPVGTISVGEK